jgi:Putative Flp pilus-assembly TadE/G-like
MLAQFALIAFAIFGVLSLVVDIGYVRLTQVEMQTAADTAALEGLRLRNSNLSDGFAADCQRRIAARDIVRRTFADEVDSATGETRVRSGAGPIIGFHEDGVGDLNARQTFTHEFALYKPNLELNQTTPSGANLEYGDMVSGSFVYQTGSREDASYTRLDGDFIRNPIVPAPDTGYTGCPDTVPLDAFGNPTWPEPPSSGPIEGTTDLAFLVRLRRTNNFEGMDDVGGVSSGASTIPLLFGRGTTTKARQDDVAYSPRHHGVTVRAAGIANARPALRVGLPAAGRNGVVPFAVDRAFYTTFNNGDPSGPPPVTGSIDPATGQISDGGGMIVGQLVSDADRLSIATVGSVLPPPSMSVVCDPTKTPEENAIAGFGPVYTPVGPSAALRVIGFGRVEMVWPNCAASSTAVQFFRHAQIVAVANATAVLPGGLPVGLPPTDIPELMLANRSLAAPATGGLLAAALAR